MRRWAAPFFLILALGILIFSLLSAYFDSVSRHGRLRAQTLNAEISENLRLLVDGHTRVLRTIGQIELQNIGRRPEIYLSSAEAVLHNYEGFYAINYIDADGVIRRVHPFERNKAALEKRLFDHPQVAGYLTVSRAQHVPMISELLPSFQGIEAFMMYVPVFENGRFYGWINGVIDLPGWMNRYLESRATRGLAVRVDWIDVPGSVYRFGPAPSKDAPSLDFRLLNQNLRVTVEVQGAAQEAPAAFRWTIWGAACALIGLIGALVFSLENSLQTQRALNRRLHLKNTIVSSLAHDMGTPLTVLSLGLDRLRHEPSSASLWNRVQSSTASLRQMLDSVKLLHAMETGRMELKPEALDIGGCLQDAVDHVSEIAAAKGITFDIGVAPNLPKARAERATLCQNVIPNALTNAIKFSPPNSHVDLQVWSDGDKVILSVRDSGMGIEPERLRLLLDDGALSSQDGTKGERGSGLGMLQMKTFMEIYGGSMGIISVVGEGHGTEVRLNFKKA